MNYSEKLINILNKEFNSNRERYNTDAEYNLLVAGLLWNGYTATWNRPYLVVDKVGILTLTPNLSDLEPWKYARFCPRKMAFRQLGYKYRNLER